MAKKRIAVYRPLWARNNTAFEGQARLYARLVQSGDADITVFSNWDNHFSFAGLKTCHVGRPPPSPASGGGRFGPTREPEIADLLGRFDVIETSDPTLYDYAYDAYGAAKRHGTFLSCGSSVTLTHLVTQDLGKAREVMDHSHTIACCTPLAQRRFEELGVLDANSDKVIYSGHAVDTDLFCPGVALRGPFNVLCVGRLSSEKGHAYLAEALAVLRKRGTDLRWRIVGEGPTEAALREQVRQLGLGSITEFLGRVPNEQLPSLYRRAHVLGHTCTTTEQGEEYFGVVLAEAMACGVPVVSTFTGGIPYVVESGVTGTLVAQQDVGAIVDALAVYADDRSLLRTHGRAARQRVEDHFSFPVIMQRYRELWGL